MDWYKQRTGYYREPEMIDAGEEAEVLHQRAKAYAAETESSGFIPAGALVYITPKRPRQRAETLVRVGLWRAVDGGFLIADWDEDQAELEALAARRRSDRERKRAQRDRDRADEHPPGSRDESADVSRDSHVNVRKPKQPYTRADREKEKEEEHPPESLRDSGPPAGGDADAAKPKTRRGTRIPDDFAITDAMRDWGRTNFPQVNGEKETEAFVDYWRGIAGLRGTKLDWPATWRNWIRKAAEHAATSRNGNGQHRNGNGADRPVHIPRPIAEVLAEQARYSDPIGNLVPLFPQAGMSVDG